MANFALFVAALVLLVAFGLVGWLRRVVASVDAPPGTPGTTGPGEAHADAATRTERRAAVTPLGARLPSAPDAVRDDLRWIGNFRTMARGQHRNQPTFHARPARKPS